MASGAAGARRASSVRARSAPAVTTTGRSQSRAGSVASAGTGDDTIRVTVVAIKGGKVRLGFTAPITARVVRQEIYEDRTQLPAGAVSPAPAQPEVAASSR